MFEELKGIEVLIQMGSASMVTDRLKGRVIDVGEAWIKIQSKKKTVYINLAKVGSIATDI